MPPSSRKISPAEWERHKATILGLRFKDKLPLKAPDAAGRSLIQVMKDEHNFHATASQYESQIAKWGAVKNLKKRDWESILPVYDHLQSQGLEPRIRVGDHIFDAGKIKKARYHYRGGQISAPSDNVALASSSDEIRPWCLEFRQPNGQYVEYFKRNENSNLSLSSSSSALVHTDIRPTTPSQPSQIQSHAIEHVLCAADTMTSELMQYPLSLNTPRCEMLDMDMPNSPSIYLDLDNYTFDPTNAQCTGFPAPVMSPQYESPNVDHFIYPILHPPSFPREWFSDCNPETLLSPTGLTGSEIDGIRQASSPHPQLATLAHINPLLERIAQHPRWRDGDIRLLSVDNILERLVSLPQASFFGSSSTVNSTLVSVRDRVISISDIYARIMYSLMNNFAGIEPMQRLAIFSVLRLTPDGMSYLIGGLRSDQHSIAKPVASNLFQLAIEAGDEEVVSIILKETSRRTNEIKVDEPIYNYRGSGPKKSLPLALAAEFHHLGVFKAMLAHGAKISVEDEEPNCSTFKAVIQASCDRCLDVRNSTTHEEEVASIVKKCLSCEPQQVINYLIQALPTKSYLCEMLFEAVPEEHYPKLFTREAWREWNNREARSRQGSYHDLPLDEYRIPILRFIQQALDNEAADKMIKTLLATCQRLNFIPAPFTEYTRLLNEAAAMAISNNNIALVRYLLNHIKPTLVHLASAVHHQDIEMVDLILERGAAPGGDIACLTHMYDRMSLPNGECTTDVNDCTLSTPLAEAIRWKNTALIDRLQQGGAFDTLSDDRGLGYSEFKVAAVAASEVGDYGYLKSLITLAPTRNNMHSLGGPIVGAIDDSELLIASELIAHHAQAASTINLENESMPVVNAAVRTGNMEFIDQVIEQYLFTNSEAALDIATSIGHTHVVEKFLQRGARIFYQSEWESSLTQAIKNHDFSTMRLLLEWGASPDYLKFAVDAGDNSMVLLLLDHGADPADDEAICTAIEDCKKDIFFTLIGTFSSRYPNGKKGFGYRILAQAIISRDLACLDTLFKAKLGVKTHSGQALCNDLLFYAIEESGKGDAVIYDVIFQLLEAGADPDAGSMDSWNRHDTALLSAIEKKDMRLVRMLLDRGADIQRPARNVLKRTPLQQACEQGYFQMIKFLLDKGADVNAPAALNGGATALQLAAIQGNSDIVLFLLSKGAKIHDHPAVINGRTALEGAAEHGRVSVLSILLAQGASGYRLKDIDQALRYAEEQGHEGCAHTLKLTRFKLASLEVQ